jgi:hypothetical protein
MNFPRMIEVKPQKNMILTVKFENGIKKKMDIKPYIKKFADFQQLRDESIFQNVHLEHFGKVIVWDKKADIYGLDIWEDGETIND